MKITKTLTDESILAELGARLTQRRLDLQLSQADLAEQAGVSKRTVERIEAGASAQMSSLIRVLRVLDSVPGLDRVIPETVPSPMDLLRRQGKARQRVSKKAKSNQNDAPWTWDEKT